MYPTKRLHLLLGAALLASATVLATPAEAAGRNISRHAEAKKQAHPARKSVKKVRPARASAAMRRASPLRASAPATVARLAGLHRTDDPLDLSTGAALLIDAATEEVVYAKNETAKLPIASITKLMTSLIVVESGASMDETLTITNADVDRLKGSSSRLAVGTQLTRGEMLHLALMASENRAAHALARNHPQGLRSFIEAMNAKAKLLGMSQTTYVDPTGLSSHNQSSPIDLARLMREVSGIEEIAKLSTAKSGEVDVAGRKLEYRNTNELVRSGAMDILVQKTGYIRDAGRCLVMEVEAAGRRMVMVLLDAVNPKARSADARKLRDLALRYRPTSTPAAARRDSRAATGTGSTNAGEAGNV